MAFLECSARAGRRKRIPSGIGICILEVCIEKNHGSSLVLRVVVVFNYILVLHDGANTRALLHI